MPLPWKKDKDKPKKNINRNRSLSKFINEIRASKRGESLVVETGFPTSVIDLIVKNRNRFSNNNGKHQDHHHHYSDHFDHSPRQPNTPLAPLILNSIDTLMSETESLNDDLVTETGDDKSSFDVEGGEKEICAVNNVEEREFEIQKVEGTVRKDRNFMIVIKVFVVLILAISTKKFAVSITLSAFILLFLEILFKTFANEYRRLTVVSVHIEREERRLSLVGVDDDVVVANFVDFREEIVKERKVTKDETLDSHEKSFKFPGCDQVVIGDGMTGKPRITVSEFPSCDRDEMMGKPRRTVSDKLRAKFKKLGGELKNRRSKKDCKLEQSNLESTDCIIEDVGEDQEKDEEDDDRDEESAVGVSSPENNGVAKTKDRGETDVGEAFEKPRRTSSTKLRAQRFVKKLGDELKHRRSKKDRKLDKNTVQSTQKESIQEVEEQEKDAEVDDDHIDEDAEEEKVDTHDGSIQEASSDSGFQKSTGRERNWNWSTSIIVMLVFAALVGGRIMALVLSILCLLLHRLVGGNIAVVSKLHEKIV